jgi:hypothetical protein
MSLICEFWVPASLVPEEPVVRLRAEHEKAVISWREQYAQCHTWVYSHQFLSPHIELAAVA